MDMAFEVEVHPIPGSNTVVLSVAFFQNCVVIWTAGMDRKKHAKKSAAASTSTALSRISLCSGGADSSTGWFLST